MKRVFVVLMIVLISASGIVNAQGKKSIFNGENLDGWKIHGTEKWYVEDGLLVCESGPDKEYGYLSTEKNYDDFILTLEFLQESNGNSGVFIRSTFDLRAQLALLMREGAKRSMTSTQVNNSAVQRVWLREGFVPRESCFTVHLNF